MLRMSNNVAAGEAGISDMTISAAARPRHGSIVRRPYVVTLESVCIEQQDENDRKKRIC